MTPAFTKQSTENMGYVRRLRKQKQPGFSDALESALVMAEREPWPQQMPKASVSSSARTTAS